MPRLLESLTFPLDCTVAERLPTFGANLPESPLSWPTPRSPFATFRRLPFTDPAGWRAVSSELVLLETADADELLTLAEDLGPGPRGGLAIVSGRAALRPAMVRAQVACPALVLVPDRGARRTIDLLARVTDGLVTRTLGRTLRKHVCEELLVREARLLRELGRLVPLPLAPPPPLPPLDSVLAAHCRAVLGTWWGQRNAAEVLGIKAKALKTQLAHVPGGFSALRELAPRRLRGWVISGNPALAQVLPALLADEPVGPFELTAFRGGREARAALVTGTVPEVALADGWLPDDDPAALAAALTEARPEVVLLGVFADPPLEEIQRIHRAGAAQVAVGGRPETAAAALAAGLARARALEAVRSLRGIADRLEAELAPEPEELGDEEISLPAMRKLLFVRAEERTASRAEAAAVLQADVKTVARNLRLARRARPTPRRKRALV